MFRNRLFFSFVLILLLIFQSFAFGDVKKVLFIGNSFTAGMPEIVTMIAASKGDSIETYHHWGGQTLFQHASNPETEQVIKSNAWDYIVLQENSQISGFYPGWEQGYFEYYAYDAANYLDSIAKSNNECCQTCFFMTWGYLNGDRSNFPDDTYENQQNRIRRNYLFLTDEFDGMCAPVGMAWRHVREHKPWLNLYAPDNYHPNEYSIYLNACVFYATLFEKSPVGDTNTGMLPDSVSSYLQETAAMVVLDSLQTWQIGTRVPNNPPEVVWPKTNSIARELAVKFEWYEDQNIESYEIRVSPDLSFDSLIIDTVGITGTSLTKQFQEYGRDYYFQLRGRFSISDTKECVTQWTNAIKFTTPYEGPRLISPENEADCVHLKTRFEWEELEGAKHYRLQVSEDPTYTNIIENASGIAEPHFDFEFPNELKDYYWRVQKHEAAITEKWSEQRSLTTTIFEPDPVYPPQGEIAVDPEMILFEWNHHYNDSQYSIQIAGDKDFDNMVLDKSNISETSVSFTTELFHKTYYWRVSASNFGCTSAWSDIMEFRTQMEAPELIYPENNSAKQPTSIRFEWRKNTIDTKEEIKVALDPDFENVIFGRQGLASSLILVRDLEPRTKYYWKVRSSDEQESSGWSEVFVFETGEKAPDIITLIYPADGSVKIPLGTELEWHSSVGGDTYQLQVSETDDFQEFLIDEKNLGDTVKTIQLPDNYTIYYWRIRAAKDDLRSEWSEIWNFRTIAATITESPQLVYPADSVDGIGKEIEFEWETVNPSETYHLQISLDQSFSTEKLILSDSSIVSNNYLYTELQDDFRYFWRVCGRNEAGAGPWSSIRTFKTEKVYSVDDNHENSELTIKPNPGKGIFTVEAPELIREIRITDLSGKTLFKRIFTEMIHSSKIEPRNIGSGIYFIECHTRKGVYFGKIIVEK